MRSKVYSELSALQHLLITVWEGEVGQLDQRCYH